MSTIAKIDQLVAKTGASFSEAKAALEASDGDVLEAALLLEYMKKNREKENQNQGSYYRSTSQGNDYDYSSDMRKGTQNSESFFKQLWYFLSRNYFEISRNGEAIVALPLYVMLLLLYITHTFLFLTVIILLCAFAKFRFQFTGSNFQQQSSINRFLARMAEVMDGKIKKNDRFQ